MNRVATECICSLAFSILLLLLLFSVRDKFQQKKKSSIYVALLCSTVPCPLPPLPPHPACPSWPRIPIHLGNVWFSCCYYRCFLSYVSFFFPSLSYFFCCHLLTLPWQGRGEGPEGLSCICRMSCWVSLEGRKCSFLSTRLYII